MISRIRFLGIILLGGLGLVMTTPGVTRDGTLPAILEGIALNQAANTQQLIEIRFDDEQPTSKTNGLCLLDQGAAAQEAMGELTIGNAHYEIIATCNHSGYGKYEVVAISSSQNHSYHLVGSVKDEDSDFSYEGQIFVGGTQQAQYLFELK